MTSTHLSNGRRGSAPMHRAGSAAATLIASILPARLMRSKRYFEIWERRGYHVIPVHFYEPVPAIRDLPASLWQLPSEAHGIDFRIDEQVSLLREVVAYRDEYADFRQRDGSNQEFVLDNGRFDAVDAEIFYSLLRINRPRRVIEIGSGWSTVLALEALNRNGDDAASGELITIDPFPSDVVAKCSDDRLTRWSVPVQDVDLREFESLTAGDVLFIDSSHVLATGSDVQFELLEVLPRLKRGVLVHFHDIFLPHEYPSEWVLGEKRFWTEQYGLQAFLAFNSEFRVVWSGQQMHRTHSALLADCFPGYDARRHSPGSFWIVRQEARA